MAKSKLPKASSSNGEPSTRPKSKQKALPKPKATALHRTRSVSTARPNESPPGSQILQQKPATALGTPAKTSNESVVTVHQSVEIVQTLLHGCVSSLAFMRIMFHEDCYDRRYYAGTQSHWAYRDYASGKQEVDPAAKAGSPTKNLDDIKKGVPALKRGVSSRVDQLLDLLETGVFDALQRGYLHSLHLAIIEDPKRREDVLELYTFTFQYASASTDTGTQVVSSIEVTEHRGNKVTLKQARSSLKSFVLKMIELCYNLPELPDLRFLTLDITYTSNAPPEYRAPGFGMPATNIAKFPNDGWQKSTIPISKLNAGFHCVALKATYLNPTSVEDENVGDDDNITIPNGLTFGQSTNKTDDIENNFSEPVSSRYKSGTVLEPHDEAAQDEENQSFSRVPHSQPPVNDSASSSRSPIPDPTEMDLNQQASLNPSSRQVSADGHQQDLVSGLLDEERGTSTDRVLVPSPEDLRDKAELEKMLQGSMSQRTDLEPTQVQSNPPELSQNYLGSKLQISQGTLRQLKWRRSNQLPPQKGHSVVQNHSGNVDSAAGSDVVSCQCGHSSDEGEMVHCDFCYTWQHLHCYGYLDAEHSRVPDDYACYKCLLPNEEATLKKVRDLAIYRRVLFKLQEQDFDNEKQFAKALGWEQQDAARIVKKLRNDNLLATTSGPKKGNGKHRIVLNRSEETSRHIKEVYFDPTASIAHHLNLPMSPELLIPNASVSGTLDASLPRKRPRESRDDSEAVPVAKKTWGWSSTVAINVQEGYSPSTSRLKHGNAFKTA